MFSFFVEPPRILWAGGSAIVLGLVGIVASISGFAGEYYPPLLGIPVAAAVFALGVLTLVFTELGTVDWEDLPTSRKRIVVACAVVGVLTFIYVGLLLLVARAIHFFSTRR